MKPAKYRDQSADELRQEEVRLKEQLFRLRFQLAVGQAENPMRIRAARKDLARVQTILNEKKRAAEAGSGEGG